jgi:hypothetical protein
MQVLSKGPYRMEILAGDLLPWQGHLFLLAIDGDSTIHVFQYDPERKHCIPTIPVSRGQSHLAN